MCEKNVVVPNELDKEELVGNCDILFQMKAVIFVPENIFSLDP